MKQLTREEAVVFAESGAWKEMTDDQLVWFQFNQKKICVPVSHLHVALEGALGRDVYSHEFHSKNGWNRMINEFMGRREMLTPAESLSMLEQMTSKPLVVVVVGP